MALQFTRNAKVYIYNTKSDVTWKVNVLDGFSFSQSQSSSEVTINEAGRTSRRARLLFNDALDPVEWSFSTYARPTYYNTKARAPEEALWAMLGGADTFNTTTHVFQGSPVVGAGGNTYSPNAGIFNFTQSNVSSMSENWEIVVGFEETGNTQYYRLTKAVVNSVTMDFDIDGIATLQWSGLAREIIDAGTGSPVATEPLALNPVVSHTFGLTDTDNFIRNRISTVDLVWKNSNEASPIADDTYNLVLTGGSITVENNISYLTPEELGVVNKPLANVTGARSISGSLTCYLDTDTAASKSGELFADMSLASNTTIVRNVFDMAVNVGGTGYPSVSFDLPTAHLEIPSINVEDLLTLEINFHGQPANGNVDSTDEMTVIYRKSS